LDPLPTGYRPRRPETTVLYRIVADNLETMLAQARERSSAPWINTGQRETLR
jgi:hypothetical protein